MGTNQSGVTGMPDTQWQAEKDVVTEIRRVNELIDEARRELRATWRAERERAALENALATLRQGVEISLPAAP